MRKYKKPINQAIALAEAHNYTENAKTKYDTNLVQVEENIITATSGKQIYMVQYTPDNDNDLEPGLYSHAKKPKKTTRDGWKKTGGIFPPVEKVLPVNDLLEYPVLPVYHELLKELDDRIKPIKKDVFGVYVYFAFKDNKILGITYYELLSGEGFFVGKAVISDYETGKEQTYQMFSRDLIQFPGIVESIKIDRFGDTQGIYLLERDKRTLFILPVKDNEKEKTREKNLWDFLKSDEPKDLKEVVKNFKETSTSKENQELPEKKFCSTCLKIVDPSHQCEIKPEMIVETDGKTKFEAIKTTVKQEDTIKTTQADGPKAPIKATPAPVIEVHPTKEVERMFCDKTQTGRILSKGFIPCKKGEKGDVLWIPWNMPTVEVWDYQTKLRKDGYGIKNVYSVLLPTGAEILAASRYPREQNQEVKVLLKIENDREKYYIV